MIKRTSVCIFLLVLVSCARAFLYVRPTSIAGISTQTSKIMSANTDLFEYLEFNTLVSVQECIRAHNTMKEQGSTLTEKDSKSVFVDASWWHKGDLNGRKMFEEGPRIPGSKYIDIDDIALTDDLNKKLLPHMLPTKELFARAMDIYGISNEDHIIITARESVYFTPRTWFLFKTFGHDPKKLHLMQGSLSDWIENGGAVEKEQVTIPVFQNLTLGTMKAKTNYKVKDASNVCDIEELMEIFRKPSMEDTLILDSRGSSFAKGHMPGAIHLPYSNWVEPENSLKWKSISDLNSIFAEAGVDPLTDKNIVCSCGSGVSVCHTMLALELCGRDLQNTEKTKMYDGSWSEWGKENYTPKKFDAT